MMVDGMMVDDTSLLVAECSYCSSSKIDRRQLMKEQYEKLMFKIERDVLDNVGGVGYQKAMIDLYHACMQDTCRIDKNSNSVNDMNYSMRKERHKDLIIRNNRTQSSNPALRLPDWVAKDLDDNDVVRSIFSLASEYSTYFYQEHGVDIEPYLIYAYLNPLTKEYVNLIFTGDDND